MCLYIEESYSQHVFLDAVLKLLAESIILYKLNNLAPCFIYKGSMYLCLPTSICKGVSERPRIRRAVTQPVSESNSVMTECARATFSTAALMMCSLELVNIVTFILLNDCR
uniref:Uncharacterized protein n=1 Tax=Ficedula albicollis TaxID=59894 RepID=A0A803VJ65_FICAL